MRDVADQWLERHVRGQRTERERARIISRYIVPRIGDQVFADVRRKDIAELLDRIEDESGKPMADGVLNTFRAISRWVQQRDESYHPPLTAGMSRVPKGEGRRKRILADDEIRAIWRVEGQYGDFVRLALLTAQRREKLITLRWDDIKDGVWTIRTEPREKGNPGKLALPQIALDIIRAQPRFVGNPYVFAGRNNGPTTAFGAGQYKAQFDELCGVTGWRVHDLRRTARSLMSRAGVQTEIAEMVLGHARDELLQIYDRHHYQDEMAEALTKLAALIERILWRIMYVPTNDLIIRDTGSPLIGHRWCSYVVLQQRRTSKMVPEKQRPATAAACRSCGARRHDQLGANAPYANSRKLSVRKVARTK